MMKIKENKIIIIICCLIIFLMLILLVEKGSAKEFEVPDGYVLISETSLNKRVTIYEIKHKKTGCHSKVIHSDYYSTVSVETEWTKNYNPTDRSDVTVPYCTKIKGGK